MAYPFLSEEWLQAAAEIRRRLAPVLPAVPVVLRANLVVNAVPFGEGSVVTHIDTSSGRVAMGDGALETADVVLTMGYAAAKAFMLDHDQDTVRDAFAGGAIRVTGDLAKLMALSTASQGAAMVPAALTTELRAITAL